MKSGINFFKDLKSNRKFIVELAIRDFFATYLSSALGLFWAVVEPAVYVGMMYVFFTKALKFVPANDTPYVPWLMTSMSLWTFFGGVVNSSAGVFKSHSYLLRRWNFNMSILPIVSIITHLIFHGIFLMILFLIYWLSGISFSIWWFQAFYYLFSLCILVIGMSWIFASMSLFLHDVNHIISVILQMGFWISPIFWDINTFPHSMRIFMKLNPLYYIMTGYRNSFIYHIPFWQDWQNGLYFWCFTLVTLTCGYISYKRLRPYFGDVI